MDRIVFYPCFLRDIRLISFIRLVLFPVKHTLYSNPSIFPNHKSRSNLSLSCLVLPHFTTLASLVQLVSPKWNPTYLNHIPKALPRRTWEHGGHNFHKPKHTRPHGHPVRSFHAPLYPTWPHGTHTKHPFDSNPKTAPLLLLLLLNPKISNPKIPEFQLPQTSKTLKTLWTLKTLNP